MRKIFQSIDSIRKGKMKRQQLMDISKELMWKLDLKNKLVRSRHRAVTKILLDLQKLLTQIVKDIQREERQARIEARLQKLLTKRVK